jgi:hypothetical protein
MDCDQAKELSHESEMSFDYSGRSLRIADNKTAAAFLYYRLQTASLTVSYCVRGRARGGGARAGYYAKCPPRSPRCDW